MSACLLCPRRCGIDRSGTKGFCGVADGLKVARAALHMWEEPCISGSRGSGTVFFSGCPLGCVYCQNSEISRGGAGKTINASRLSEIFLELEAQGAHNINLVTPTHFAREVVRALGSSRRQGLLIPIVCNTGGYENVETLRIFEGYIDIYLADFKYFSPLLADRYSGAKDYPAIARTAFEEMFRQVGRSEFCRDGIMRRGLIARHLVLPGCVGDSKKVVKYLHGRFGEDIFISIMNQYTPGIGLEGPDQLGRRLTPEEYSEVVDFALELGVENGFVQEEGTAEESFIPPFDNYGV